MDGINDKLDVDKLGADKQGEPKVDGETEEDEQLKAEYVTKIEALDERLNAFRTNKTDERKRSAMISAKYDEEQVERFINHVEGETVSEIKASVEALREDIKPSNALTYADGSIGNGGRTSPPKTNLRQAGRNLLTQVNQRRGR